MPEKYGYNNQTAAKQGSLRGARNPFSGPIPGQSLTKPPGASKMEQPPAFVDIEKATEATFNMMTKPKNVAKLVALFQNGMTAEAYARTVSFAGAVEGKWTPDVALLIAPVVQAQAIAVAKKAGMKDKEIKVANPRPEDIEFFEQLGNPLDKMEKEPKMMSEEAPMEEVDEEKFKGIFGEV